MKRAALPLAVVITFGVAGCAPAADVDQAVWECMNASMELLYADPPDGGMTADYTADAIELATQLCREDYESNPAEFLEMWSR